MAGEAEANGDDVVGDCHYEDGGDEVLSLYRCVDELAEGVEAAPGEDEVCLALDGSYSGGGCSTGSRGSEGEAVVASVSDEECLAASVLCDEIGFLFGGEVGVDVFGRDAEFVGGFANAEEIGIAAEDAKVEAMFSKSVHLVDGSVADGFVDVEGGYVHAVFGQGAAGFFRIGFLRAGPAAATKTPASSSDATTDATTGESLYRKV